MGRCRPNGAGKSTLASARVAARIPFVNPDDIARRIQPTGDPTTRTLIAAARQATGKQNRLLAARQSFGFETTLSGKRELKIMQEAKEAGYKVNLIFIGIAGAEGSAARVAQRVATGGHNVPEADLKRRYPRSLENLSQAAAHADRLYVLDNSEKRRRLVLDAEHGRVKYVTPNMPEWAKRPLSATLGL